MVRSQKVIIVRAEVDDAAKGVVDSHRLFYLRSLGLRVSCKILLQIHKIHMSNRCWCQLFLGVFVDRTVRDPTDSLLQFLLESSLK